jgi:hypothetical protein
MIPRKEKINNGSISKEHKKKVLNFLQNKSQLHNKNTTPKKKE